MTLYAFTGALEQGFAFGLMVVGVWLTFRVLDFPDLTVDGSLPLGAAVSAVAIGAGVPPAASVLLAGGAGFLAGMVTGLLNTKLRILHLLASILTMIALYSVNLRIMGKPNLALLGDETLVDQFQALTGLESYLSTPLLFALVSLAAVLVVGWLLRTQWGMALLATGDNRQMITSLGVDTDRMIILGVGLSNALVACSGALVAQNQGSADVNMGVGTIVAGLASVIVGEALFGKGSVVRALAAALLGSVVYRLAIALALSLNLGAFSITPSDLKLVTAVLVVVALTLPRLKAALRRREVRT
ncbi:MAG: ABC transporter permease [Desulfovibrionaceae bacterium]